MLNCDRIPHILIKSIQGSVDGLVKVREENFGKLLFWVKTKEQIRIEKLTT